MCKRESSEKQLCNLPVVSLVEKQGRRGKRRREKQVDAANKIRKELLFLLFTFDDTIEIKSGVVVSFFSILSM